MESLHLLKLPQELRNEVFRHLFQASSGFSYFGANRFGFLQPRLRWFFLTPEEVACLRAFLIVTMTCRQLRNEATQMLFELNGFKTFATSGLPEVPNSFIHFVQKLNLYGFQNDRSGYMWLSDCDSIVRIRKERDRIVGVAESKCSQGCRTHGVLSHWDLATHELVLATPRDGVLIKVAWKDLILDPGWIRSSTTNKIDALRLE